MKEKMLIRQIERTDIEAVEALWTEAGMTNYALAGDVAQEIIEKMTRDLDLFLVGETGGQIVATVMGTYDGHRGRIKRLAIHHDHRRQGFGQQITDELERRFTKRGIARIRLEVWASNTGAQTFWEEAGYEVQPDIRYYLRNLDNSKDPC
jgi:ribosomal protein S18 acetylase RimI-like enzyme